MAWALSQRDLSPLEKLALVVLANRSDNAGNSFMSHATIAGHCGCSRRSIITALAELEGKELIERTERPRTDGSGRTSDLIRIRCANSSQPKRENGCAGISPPVVQNFHTIPTTPYGVSKNSKKEGATGI